MNEIHIELQENGDLMLLSPLSNEFAILVSPLTGIKRLEKKKRWLGGNRPSLKTDSEYSIRYLADDLDCFEEFLIKKQVKKFFNTIHLDFYVSPLFTKQQLSVWEKYLES